MTETPSRALLLELGQDQGWPSVTLGRVTVLGVVEAWHAAGAADAEQVITFAPGAPFLWRSVGPVRGPGRASSSAGTAGSAAGAI